MSGIQSNGVFLGSMKFPDRKKPCLVIERGNSCEVIGHFIDDYRAEKFLEALREILEGRVEDGE